MPWHILVPRERKTKIRENNILQQNVTRPLRTAYKVHSWSVYFLFFLFNAFTLIFTHTNMHTQMLLDKWYLIAVCTKVSVKRILVRSH